MFRKPKYLPQISAPFEFIVDGLAKENVVYKDVTLMPDEILPSQSISFLDTIEIDKNKEMDHIWLAGETDEENTVIDGHHRWVDCLGSNTPIRAIKIQANQKDACRVLNKIQDIYEYQKSVSLEEISTNFQNFNDRNDKDTNDWLGTITEESKEINSEKKNPKTIVGYRDKPINENSVVGNFFSLNKLDRCDKYEIEFENLLDTKDLGVDYKDGQIPTDVLVMLWFPSIDFNGLSEKYNTSVENLKNKAISEYSRKMGYDGIKYGDIMVQGFN